MLSASLSLCSPVYQPGGQHSLAPLHGGGQHSQEQLQDGGATQLQHQVTGHEERSGRILTKRDLTLAFFVDSLGVRPQLLARIGGELYSVG